MSEYKFPTEVVNLPSNGTLYPEDSPLRDGTIEIKYMTAKEEDILTSTNLIRSGMVLEKLLDSLIVTEGVKSSDLLVGDANAVMISSRVLAYGKDYPVTLQCSNCLSEFEQNIDLSELESYDVDVSPNENGEFELTLPTKTVVTIKLLTRKEDDKMEKEIESIKKKLGSAVEPRITTLMRYIITSVDGERDKLKIAPMIENMIVRDTKAVRDFYKKVNPNVDTTITISCPNCGFEETGEMPMTANFFWPDF